MIDAHGLGRRYGRTTALEGLDLRVAAGEVVGLLGPNGAGKTTTLRILAGALAPSSGTVRVAEVDAAADPLGVRARLGYLPERPPLYDDMRVRAYVAHTAVLRGVDDVPGATDRALTRAGVDDVADRLIGRLSKGYRQRVGLAQALVHDPAVLLLDEPVSDLDPAQRASVRQLVRALADGATTIVVSTHVLADVAAVCDRAVVLFRGRRVLDLDLRRSAGLRVVVAHPDGLAAALRAIPGVTDVEVMGVGAFRLDTDGDVRADVARIAAHHDLLELTPALDLERAYLQVTGARA